MASAKKPMKKPAQKTEAKKAEPQKAAPTDAAPQLAGAPGTLSGSTLGQAFGEMVWLLSQSPLHKNLKLADLEWLIMPAIVLNQARVFKVGTQAVGLALWAYLTPDKAAEMNKAGRLKPEGWRHGTDIMQVITAQKTEKKAGDEIDLTLPELKEGALELWLVDLIVPHATPENKLAEACLSDLLTGPLKGKKLKMQRVDAKTGEKSTIELGGE